MKNLSGLVFLFGFMLLIGIVILNTYVVFFTTTEYSGGMIALSAVWIAVGWILMASSVKHV